MLQATSNLFQSTNMNLTWKKLKVIFSISRNPVRSMRRDATYTTMRTPPPTMPMSRPPIVSARLEWHTHWPLPLLLTSHFIPIGRETVVRVVYPDFDDVAMIKDLCNFIKKVAAWMYTNRQPDNYVKIQILMNKHREDNGKKLRFT